MKRLFLIILLSQSIWAVWDVPILSPVWDPSIQAVKVNYTDRSDEETNYWIFRSDSSMAMEFIDGITINDPSFMGDTFFIDTSAEPGKLYYYLMSMMGNPGVNSTNAIPVYTIDPPDSNRGIKLLDKISDFPINYRNWAMKIGKIIVVDEPMKTLHISVLNVEQPDTIYGINIYNCPRFKGSYYTYNNHLIIADTAYTIYSYYLRGFSLYRDTIIKGEHGLGVAGDRYLICKSADEQSCDTTYSVYRMYDMGNDSLSYMKDVAVAKCRHCDIKEDLHFRAFFDLKSYNSYDCIGNNDSIMKYIVVDFNDNPLMPAVRTYDTITIPSEQTYNKENGLYLTGETLLNAKRIFLDTLEKHAFVLTESLLSIYNYSVENFSNLETRPGIKRPGKDYIRISPNPFNTRITVTLYNMSDLKSGISIYNIKGELVEEFKELKSNSIVWHAAGLSNGIYILRFIHRNRVFSRKIVLQK
jgi:hypothetical protein